MVNDVGAFPQISDVTEVLREMVTHFIQGADKT